MEVPSFISLANDSRCLVCLILVLLDPQFLQVKAVAEEMGIGFLGIGFQPKWSLKEIPVMPKVWNICSLYSL